MEEVEVTLHAKKIRFRSRRKAFQPPRLSDVLADNIKDGQAVRDRHWPHLPVDSQVVHRCMFIQTFRKLPGGAFQFTLCSYVPGHAPILMEKSFEEPEATLDNAPITDKDGNPLEVVVMAQCLTYGEALLMNLPDNLGGTRAVADYLTYLLRCYLEPNHPKVHLVDVMPPNMADAIRHGGGCKEMILKIDHAPASKPNSKFSTRLTDVRKQVHGTRLLSVSYKAASNSTLSSADVLAAHEEYEKVGELDDIVIVLGNGERVVGSNKLKLRHKAKVGETSGRNPNLVELKRELVDYLKDLMIPDDKARRVLDEHGNFVTND